MFFVNLKRPSDAVSTMETALLAGELVPQLPEVKDVSAMRLF